MRKVIFLLLIFLFIGGCFSEKSYVYNGFKIDKHSLGVAVTAYVTYNGVKQEHIINLRYGPKELEDIKVEGSVKDVVLGAKQLYVSVDPDMSNQVSIAAMDVMKVTGTHPSWGIFKIPTQAALSKPQGDNLVKTCEDAINGEGVILFEDGNVTEIYSDKDCVVLKVEKEEDLVKVGDKLVYVLLGIM